MPRAAKNNEPESYVIGPTGQRSYAGYEYKPLTEKDVARMRNMAAICDQPSRDIRDVLPKMLGDDYSRLTYLAFIYKWGMIQGAKEERLRIKQRMAKTNLVQ